MPVRSRGSLLAGTAAFASLIMAGAGCQTHTTDHDAFANPNNPGQVTSGLLSGLGGSARMAAENPAQTVTGDGPMPTYNQATGPVCVQPVPADLSSGNREVIASTWQPVQRVSAEQSAFGPELNGGRPPPSLTAMGRSAPVRSGCVPIARWSVGGNFDWQWTRYRRTAQPRPRPTTSRCHNPRPGRAAAGYGLCRTHAASPSWTDGHAPRVSRKCPCRPMWLSRREHSAHRGFGQRDAAPTAHRRTASGRAGWNDQSGHLRHDPRRGHDPRSGFRRGGRPPAGDHARSVEGHEGCDRNGNGKNDAELLVVTCGEKPSAARR